MVEFEADDALATAATAFRDQEGVEQVVICSPDKDLAQTVSGKWVICWDRRRDTFLDEEGVIAKFGVRPVSMPDWLALVGDASDGYPGIPGWGVKSASAVLFRFEHLEAIPDDPGKLGLPTGRATKLIENLRIRRSDALLFRTLATVRRDVPLMESMADLEWKGARAELVDLCGELGDVNFPARIPRWSGT
jgi:5'-3' exonuclease